MVVDRLDHDPALRPGEDQPVGSVLVGLPRLVALANRLLNLKARQPALIKALQRVLGPYEAVDRPPPYLARGARSQLAG